MQTYCGFLLLDVGTLVVLSQYVQYIKLPFTNQKTKRNKGPLLHVTFISDHRFNRLSLLTTVPR